MPERIQYGPGKDQWGDLYLPEATARGVVVAIHGGVVLGACFSKNENPWMPSGQRCKVRGRSATYGTR